MFGLSIRGDDGQLVITDGVVSLTQKYRGQIVATSTYTRGSGYFTYYYPSTITTNDPPMVFAIPTSGCNGKGIGGFSHIGEPGAWRGFSTMLVASLFLASGGMYVGFDSGWQFSVCVFGDPRLPSVDKYGVRMYSADRKCYYDSSWPIVPFIGMMGSWNLSDFTRWYDLGSYWGGRVVIGDADHVLAKGYHSWGWDNLTAGFMLSGTGRVPVVIDVGKDDISISCSVFLGFPDSSRSSIWSVAVIGSAQHPSGGVSWMSNWRLLMADFSGV